MAMSPGYGDRLLVAPTWEPVTVADMANHSRINGSDLDNGVVSGFITAAREYVETACRRAIPQQQWMLLMDEFPGRQVDDYRPPTWRYGIIRLPRPPLISVDLIQYVDPGQQFQPFALTTLSASTDYQVDTTHEPGRVAPAPFTVWPATNPLAFNAIQVTFTAGWASADLVPARLKQAIRFLAAHLYEHREHTLEAALNLIPDGLASFITSAAPWEYA